MRWLARLGRWLLALWQWLWGRPGLRAAGRLGRLLVRPKSPYNLFVSPDAAAWATGQSQAAPAPLVAGQGRLLASFNERQTQAVNYEFSHEVLLSRQLRRLTEREVGQLPALVSQLTRRWRQPDQRFTTGQRRRRLDLRRTLKRNLPRYGGRVLDLYYRPVKKPLPDETKPAKLLLIGDVSRSMVHYATVLLYFFHLLSQEFQVESWVFSDSATEATPYFKGENPFALKVLALAQGARSWNGATRLGSSLEQILAESKVDTGTYVILATDGKVAWGGGEEARIEAALSQLRRQAKGLIILTPSAELAQAGATKLTFSDPLGSFKTDLLEIPIFAMSNPYLQLLASYADELYQVRRLGDLALVVEALLRGKPVML